MGEELAKTLGTAPVVGELLVGVLLAPALFGGLHVFGEYDFIAIIDMGHALGDQ